MKTLAGTFNQEKALAGAFSVIVKTDGSLAALHSTQQPQDTEAHHTESEICPPGVIMSRKKE